jgi:dUTP pyrophosphatase
MESIPVQIIRVRRSNWPLPEPATIQSAGVDLRADLDEPLNLEPRQTKGIPTGIAIALPEGWEAQVRPRSGLALKHSIGMLNSPGTIDADYRGEIIVPLTNLSDKIFTLNPGDRIAQLVLARVFRPQWMEVAELPPSGRGSGGFGHTGS